MTKILLQKLGANKKEAQIFLKLLELGAQPISVIAKHASIPRTSMYQLLEGLQKLGLVEEFKRAGVLYVKCIAVKDLAQLLQQKEKEIRETQNLLEQQLPQLLKLENTMSITPKVNFFEGKEAAVKMYRKILQANDFVSFFHPELVKRVMPQYFYLIPDELKKNYGKAKELLVRCKEGLEYQKKYRSSRHQIKLLPAGITFSADIIITQDTIYMISYGEKDVSAVEIINASLAETQRKIFEEFWRFVR